MLRKEFGKVAGLDERLDLTGLGNGMYFVSLRAGGEKFGQRLVISRD
ncbi:MAG: T9SS type A sorting domain-containing protein [Saprospiraceae bacterium]|nr:T9SS type A sorting domain-containing protein [Saprospiraceae bacterium]